MQSRYVQLSLHASWCIRIIRFDAVNMACPVCKLDSSKSCGQVCWILSPHCTIPFLSRYGISIPHLSQCWVPRSAFGESWPSHEPAYKAQQQNVTDAQWSGRKCSISTWLRPISTHVARKALPFIPVGFRLDALIVESALSKRLGRTCKVPRLDLLTYWNRSSSTSWDQTTYCIQGSLRMQIEKLRRRRRWQWMATS